MAAVGGVVDISSDEEDFLPVRDSPPIDSLEWVSDLFAADDDAVREDFDDLMIVSELSSPPAMQNTAKPDDLMVMSQLSSPPALLKKANADDGLKEDDDDCVILDGDPDKAVAIAEEGSAGDGSSDELQIVAEKGPVACRDFPHSRHLCSNLPFSSTFHVKHCSMCHCFVCDSLAPCKYWGNGTSPNDHCHATDKEAKWKTMRQVFKCKYLPAPGPEKHHNVVYSTLMSPRQQPMQCQVAVPHSLPSSVSQVGHPSLAIQSPLLDEGSPNQQRHPSLRVSLSVGGTVSSPRGGRAIGHARISQNTHSRAIFKRGAVSPGLTTTNASQFCSSAPDDSFMRQALPHVSQPVQVAPTTNSFTSTAQNNSFQRSFSAPIASHVQQNQPAAYCQVATNGTDAIGPQLSRCTSLTTERTEGLPEPPIDITSKRWEDILASVASDLGIAPDYHDISTTDSQHVMTNSQLVHPTADQGFGLQHESVLAMENWTPSHMHGLSSQTTGGNVQTYGPTQTTENLGHLISQSNLVPNEAHLNDFAPAPADGLSIEEAAHQLEMSRLESTNILFEFDWR